LFTETFRKETLKEVLQEVREEEVVREEESKEVLSYQKLDPNESLIEHPDPQNYPEANEEGRI